MKVSELLYLYRGWVRAKPVREGLAAVGVAIGVALVFATITANFSIGSSAKQIITNLAGSAQLQATARGLDGVPERTLALNGIREAPKALEAPIAIGRGRNLVATEIVGASASIVAVDPRIANIPASEGLMLPSSLASTLGVKSGQMVTITARGRMFKERVQQVLGPETIGPLSKSRIAFALLGYVQRLLRLPGRISTILASVEPGKERIAEASLKRAVEPTMEVTNSATDTALLDEALRPQGQSTSLFALLGVLVGVLLVLTTTMLSMTDRREELGELRLQGYSPKQLLQIVLSQGLILGGVSSLVGVVAGWVLAVTAFRSNPAYLASAFPFGSGTVVSIPWAVGVWFAGTLVACVCVSAALLDGRDGLAARVNPGLRRWLVGIAVLLLGVGLVTLTKAPLITALLLAGALFLVIPEGLAVATRLADGDVKWLRVAAGSIRASQVRSIGLAATAAIGLFGAVMAQGAHSDLLNGLEQGYAQYVGSADAWVASPSDELATSPFPEHGLAREISRVRGVRKVRSYYGGWVDMGTHRVWLIARSAPLPTGQIIQGAASVADFRLREGGWVAVSAQLAHTLGVQIGGPVTVPTPSGPKRYRLAATTTNLGWSSGVLFLSANDYAKGWPGAIPTALEIDGHPDLYTIQQMVGPGFSVQSSKQRAKIADALPRQGLQRLSQIAWLLVIAATIAVALALCASMFQRRDQLASLRLQSCTPKQIQMILAWEAVLVVGSGALLGSIAGVYGHFAADRYLHDATGYPVVWSLGLPVIAWTVCAVVIVTVLILIAPGRSVSRSPLRLALEGR